jgi:pyrroloquinoline quinone biosynthesis protein B
MRIEILGSAAGGGFPQWNCACSNCLAIRKGTFAGKTRSQLQVAISGDGESWFLLNASPDLRVQIEANPCLHPEHAPRHSPIAGVVLTGADLDQVLGLFLLRELQPLQVYATPSVRKIIRDDNSMSGMLHRVPEQVRWNDILPNRIFPLTTASGGNSGIGCEALPLATKFPTYVKPNRVRDLTATEATLGLILECGGRRLAYLPTVPSVNESLLARLDAADVILFDGTFWNDHELIETKASDQTATALGHIPVSETLRRFADVQRPRKIFVHINNTNPILDESRPEFRAVRDAGWEVAEDGWQLEL